MRRKNRGLLLLQLVMFTLALCVIAGERAETGVQPEEGVIHSIMVSAERIYLMQMNTNAAIAHLDSIEVEEKVSMPVKPAQRSACQHACTFTVSQTQSQTVFDRTSSHCYNFEDVRLTAGRGPPLA